MLPRFLVRVAPPADNSVLQTRLGQRGHLLWVGGPVPRGSDGITLGSLVILSKESASSNDFAELLRHEQVHVAQFREHGVFGFLRRYLGSYARFRFRGYGHWAAYRRIPLEVEARWLAAAVDASSDRGLVAAS